MQLRRPIGIVHPYVGIGAAYLHVFRTEDIAVSNAKVRTDLGPMVQAGTDLVLWRRTGLFVEVKKAWLKTTITGSVAGLPTNSRFELNPLTVTVGLRAGF
jgi:outer membrane protein